MNQYRNIVYLSDRSGTGKWRRIWPIQSLDCVAQNTNIQVDYSQTPILDENFYKGMTTVTVQRWISDQQKTIFCNFLKPILNRNNGWLIYEIDDNMASSEIPLFNRGRKAFEPFEVQNNIREMLNAADFVTVTTDYLKEFFHSHYGVPKDNIISIPNLLPRYLFDDRYNVDKKLSQFRQNKAKPRIGIVSSLSHYNIDNVRKDSDGNACRKNTRPDGSEYWVSESGKELDYSETFQIYDDIDEIIDTIRSTINDFQWVFFGYCPPKLMDLAKAQKIEVHSGVPIMNYISKFDQLNLQAIIAPIAKIPFNFSKSFIKYMECAALGVPCFATNCEPYSRVMPKQQLFDTGDELKEKLFKLKYSSAKIYEDIITNQWQWLNSKHVEGDFTINNYWLEDNLNIWTNIFRLRPKTIQVSINIFANNYEQHKKTEQENTIFKTNDIEIIK